MNLFTIKSKYLVKPTNNLFILPKTPLGDLSFELFFAGISTLTTEPSESQIINSEGSITSWKFEECFVELLQIPFIPNIPSGMIVDKCIGGVWRVKSLTEKISFKFRCYVESQIIPFAESGEGLIAQTFENSYMRLTIGTPDEELLQAKSLTGNRFPLHFQDTINSETVEYLENGIQINLPECQFNDFIEVHFIAAWSSNTNDNVFTWFAVDQPVETILQQAGVE